MNGNDVIGIFFGIVAAVSFIGLVIYKFIETSEQLAKFVKKLDEAYPEEEGKQ